MKLLFLIHDLGRGGAEKVLVNLVNHMDPEQFDITVLALFGGGVNERFLSDRIQYRTVFSRSFPGNSHLMKLLSPAALHKLFIKERYDVEISYLEGPSARIISGCPDLKTKLVSWIHGEQKTKKYASQSFRNYQEALCCYGRFDRIVCVSKTVKDDFLSLFPITIPTVVCYNTVESDRIAELSREEIEPGLFSAEDFNLISVGTLKPVKGFDRLIRILARLRKKDVSARLFLLGDGPERSRLEELARSQNLADRVSFLGYKENPYRYVAKADLFVCSSHAEGFSTAATEALIVGTPVCTTEVSGMREMLGEHDEYGAISANDEDALYQGILHLAEDPELLAFYREKAVERGKAFNTESTVLAVEEMLKKVSQIN